MRSSKKQVLTQKPINEQKQTSIKKKNNLIRRVYNKDDQSLCLFGCKSNWLQIWLDSSIQWRNLGTINLGKCGLYDNICKQFSKTKLPGLSTLYLQLNAITALGVKTILQNDLPQLKSLILSHNKIEDQGLKIIVQALTNRLISLSVENCDIYGGKLGFLLHSNIKNIIELILSDNKIGVIGIKILTKVSMPNLEKLYLENCQIGNEGVKHLNKGKWSNIEHLLLRSNFLQGNGYENVKQMQLKQTKILSTQIGQPIVVMNLLISNFQYSFPKQIKNRRFNQDLNNLMEKRFNTQFEFY